MSTQQQLEFYQKILMKEIGKAEEYSKSAFTKDVSKTYLKCIDDFIECINGKHNDFHFDRIHHSNPYLFRTILLTPDEEEDKDEEINTSGYRNVDDLWWDLQNKILNEIIKSSVRHISDDIKDFKMKWSDIPEDVRHEWYVHLFKYNVMEWEPTNDYRAFPHTHYDNTTRDLMEYRMYDLCEMIIEWIMNKYNIEIKNGEYRFKTEE